MFSPKKKWSKKPSIPESSYDGSEALLQGQMDDILDTMGIEFRRVPDGLWRFLKMCAPVQVVKQLADRWSGKPDVLMMIPINEKYSLACEVELKSKSGKFSDKQEEYRNRMPVLESRSPERSLEIIEQFKKDSDLIKLLIGGKK
jgi:hypothetical protein